MPIPEWSHAEDEILLKGKRAGLSHVAISEQLVGRTASQVGLRAFALKASHPEIRVRPAGNRDEPRPPDRIERLEARVQKLEAQAAQRVRAGILEAVQMLEVSHGQHPDELVKAAIDRLTGLLEK